jgi:hypothetical protein
MSSAKLALCAIFFSVAAFAQSDRGTITGTVSDQGGAVVPNATVTALNSENGTQVAGATTTTGNYTIPSLPAGPYSLSVEAPGFRKSVQTGILVAVASNIRVDVTLQVGATSDSVTVNAEVALLKTEDAEQSHTLTGEQIGNLPINFGVLSGGYVRSPFAFITLEPGTSNTGQNVIRVNGAPNNTEAMYFEGQEATNSLSPARIDELQPSVEAIEAAALQTSNFAAEFGQVVGGLFNFNAKSGTNQYHGSAYEYLANDALNAGLTFTNDGSGHLIRPAQRKNDFGFSVGGPVTVPHVYNGRNKSFFFLGWEFYKDSKVISGITQTVPTTQMRNGDFSQILTGKMLGTDPLGRPIFENSIYDPASARSVNGQIVTDPFVGNIIPLNRISPIAAKIQAFIPAPSNASLVNNWNQVYPTPKFQSVPSIKLDHILTDKQHLSFYFSRFRTDQYVNPDGLPVPISQLRILYERNETIRMNYDYALRPTLLIHMGAGYIMYRNPDVALSGVLAYDAPGQLGLIGGIPTDFTHTGNATGFPRLGAIATGGYGMSLPVGPSNADSYAVDKPTAVVNTTYVRGNHSYKVGADWRIDAFRNRSVNGAFGNWGFNNNETGLPYLQAGSLAGGNLGNAYASFLLGLADSASVATPKDPQFRKTSWSLFAQDTWKVTRKLTLTYGLRWDLQGAPSEIHHRFAEFSPTTPNPSVGGLPGATIYEGTGPGRCNCLFTRTYPLAVGPRLGAAWQLSERTVLRAGWGVTYGYTAPFNYIGGIIGGASVGYNSLSFVSPGFGTPAANFAQGLPYTQAQLYPTTLSAGIVPFTGQLNSPPYYIDPNGGRPPRVNQWNISLQHSLTKDLLLEAAWVGNRGAWLLGNNLIDLNGLTPQRLAGLGLNVANAADRTLLTSTFASGKPQAAGFQLPYSTFPQASTLAQALRPYPQFGNIAVNWAPLGDSWYDALQAKVTQRMWHGLYAQYAFTWQKELTTAEGTMVNDVYNRPVQKAISGSSIPLISAVLFNYQVPVMSGNKYVRAIQRDWTLGGSLRYQSGLPILSPIATNNITTVLPRQSSTFANRIPGVPLFAQDPNCHCFDANQTFVLNPAAWSQPAAGQFGTAAPYYNDYRWQRQPSESLSLGRLFRIREQMSLQVRAEFFNVFNRVYLSAPTSTNSTATPVKTSSGQTVSGFGYINTSVTSIQTGGAVPTVRNGQIVARLQF